MVTSKSKYMKTKYCLLLLILLLTSCSEEIINKPYGSNDGKAPGIVEVVDYTPIPGGVILQVRNPSDEDLLYIKAKYQLDSGKEMEERISAYSSTITLEGFGNVSEKSITLSAVDRMENEGESSTIKVTPGRPTYLKAYDSMDMYVTFGGIGVSIKNEDKNNLIIDVYTKDEKGEWYITHTEYTSKPDIAFAVRGFENSPREFGVTIRDPWENKTEPVYTTVTPWYEVELDKGKFAEVLLPNDASMAYWGFSISRIWNGNYAYGANDMCHSTESEGWPQSFTFDLGVVAKLSRYKYWQRLQDDYIYQHGNLKKWELYGRSDTPPADGSWDGWIKLMECESLKPSGLPPGQISSEDKAYAAAGEEFEFPPSTPAVRYIRWKGLETFTGAQFIHLQEVTFYGQEDVIE